MRKNDERFEETPRENSYGGFQYRWNYDEYQKSLQKKRSKASGYGMRAFFITTAFVFMMCFVSLVVVLSAALFRGAGAGRSPAGQEDGPGNYQDAMLRDPGLAESGIDRDTADVLPQVGEEPDAAMPSGGDDDSQDHETAEVNKTLTGQNISATEEEPETEESQPTENQGRILHRIAAEWTPSTVSVLCQNEKLRAVGSGFFLSDDGYLVTNHHVIRHYDAYRVRLSDGTEFDGELVGEDPCFDLAVLYIPMDGLRPVIIGNSDETMIGDSVVAIGTPASVDFEGTVTGGYISGLNRKMEIKDEDDKLIGELGMFQSTTIINPGNSGGPLFNAKGEVIGINTLKIADNGYEGMGFAIPINTVMDKIDQWILADRTKRGTLPAETEPEETETEELIDPGLIITPPPYEDTRAHAVLGIEVETITEEDSALYRIPCGALIVCLDEHTYAERIGLLRDDIILSIDDEMIFTEEDFRAWEENLRVGDVFNIVVFRSGSEITISCVIGEEEETAGLNPVPQPADVPMGAEEPAAA